MHAGREGGTGVSGENHKAGREQAVLGIAGPHVSCEQCTLGDLCLPRGLAASEIEQLDDIVRRRRILRRGERLYREGQSLVNLTVVRSGSFKSYVSTPTGDEQILSFFLPGDLMGLEALDTGAHACATISLETSSVCELPRSHLEDLCTRIPRLMRQVHVSMGRQLRQDRMLQLLLGRKSAEERLATFLVSLSRRYGERGFSPYEFVLSMSRYEIANYLGLVVETVSRVFSRLQETSILRVRRRHIRILDLPRLESMVALNGPLGLGSREPCAREGCPRLD
jgi:CRP/FNR family transcriptional regulator, anaerobic regulatory protein